MVISPSNNYRVVHHRGGLKIMDLEFIPGSAVKFTI
jgi:hypothetical protein